MRGGGRWAAALAVAALGCALAAPQARAVSIPLSTHSSDETPVGALLASFEFTVSGSTLTLKVTNQTPDPGGFYINQIFFNAASAVSLTLDEAGGTACPGCGWVIETTHPGATANGFGTFDFALIDGVGNDPHEIAPQAMLTFVFSIDSGSPAETDFITAFSTLPGGAEGPAAIVAAKFIRGPDDDSAYGATVPEPGTALLVGLGLLGLGVRRPASA